MLQQDPDKFETNLLDNVAEICPQDCVDVGQGRTHIWELKDNKTKTGMVTKYETSLQHEILPVTFSVLIFVVYPGKICTDSQLGQSGSDCVAGVRHGSVGAGGVREGIGQRGSLPRQTGLELPCPLLKHLQGGADVLQGLFSLTHCYKENRKD